MDAISRMRYLISDVLGLKARKIIEYYRNSECKYIAEKWYSIIRHNVVKDMMPVENNAVRAG